MSDRAAEFERHRGHMMALAYRMLGSLSDAEDAVQDASVRWLQTNGADIRSAEGWLVAVTTRLCIDRLRHLESERAAYPGIWLPEPILDDEPDGCIEMRADISVALLVLLRQLSPNERAVFVLHDVLEVGFEEIAAILGKSGAACRQMAHRARGRIHEDHARFPADGQAHKEIVERFMAALRSGSRSEILSVLAPEATLASDGGKTFKVSRTGIHGSDRVARLVAHGRLIPRPLRSQLHRIDRRIGAVNGEPGILTFLDDRILSALAFSIEASRIVTIHQVLDPAKLVKPRMKSEYFASWPGQR